MSTYTVILTDDNEVHFNTVEDAPDILSAILFAEQQSGETAVALVAYEGNLTPTWFADTAGIAALEAHTIGLLAAPAS